MEKHRWSNREMDKQKGGETLRCRNRDGETEMEKQRDSDVEGWRNRG